MVAVAAKSGFISRAVVRMKVHGSLYDKVSDVLDREPQIASRLRVTGESCIVAEILARDLRDLESITSKLARTSQAAGPAPGPGIAK